MDYIIELTAIASAHGGITEAKVAAPSGCIPPTAIKVECKVYYIKPELFKLGKIRHCGGEAIEMEVQYVSIV